MKTIKDIYVIQYGDKFWGTQYADGHSTSEGYGPIEKAKIVNPKYCLRPEDATYRGSHYVKELRKGKIVGYRKITILEPMS